MIRGRNINGTRSSCKRALAAQTTARGARGAVGKLIVSRHSRNSESSSLGPDICPAPKHFSPRCVLLFARPLSFKSTAARFKMTTSCEILGEKPSLCS
ncbi:hypothetical protein Q8A67_022023 [Cirrhinus molitorella]|uniref:Uncharacterized protein n=1 Tax=Cirrhinus molitorella TaxID=172907 RepID=A0AA88TDM2_9TELE|nr:hypothetical protein Q8A67_022023 [Cirrhinus molitorella]